jgi:hypothetical protein
MIKAVPVLSIKPKHFLAILFSCSFEFYSTDSMGGAPFRRLFNYLLSPPNNTIPARQLRRTGFCFFRSICPFWVADSPTFGGSGFLVFFYELNCGLAEKSGFRLSKTEMIRLPESESHS